MGWLMSQVTLTRLLWARTLRMAAEVFVGRLTRCAVEVVARLTCARAVGGAAGASQQLLY